MVAKGVRRLTEQLTEVLVIMVVAGGVGLVAAAVAAWLGERIRRSSRAASGIESHNHIKDLDRAEVGAVAQALQVELRRERRRSLWRHFLVNLWFFMLGVAVTTLVDLGFGF